MTVFFFSLESLFVLVSLILLCTLNCFSDASIHVVNLGKEYQSRPIKYAGSRMKTWFEYSARLQRIHGEIDRHMCGGGHWNVTVPDDDRPGTLNRIIVRMVPFRTSNNRYEYHHIKAIPSNVLKSNLSMFIF